MRLLRGISAAQGHSYMPVCSQLFPGAHGTRRAVIPSGIARTTHPTPVASPCASADGSQIHLGDVTGVLVSQVTDEAKGKVSLPWLTIPSLKGACCCPLHRLSAHTLS